MTFRVTILGSGSALPTPRRNPSAHVLNVHEQFFLVDCGEGTQARLMSCGINPLKINAVFISHLHGDHVYGLFGLISTLGLTGRRTPLQIFAPRPFDEILAAHRRYFDTELPYEIQWNEVRTRRSELIYENKVLEVRSVPLRHRVPAAGFLFREKTPPLNVRKEAVGGRGLDGGRRLGHRRSCKLGQSRGLALGSTTAGAHHLSLANLRQRTCLRDLIGNRRRGVSCNGALGARRARGTALGLGDLLAVSGRLGRAARELGLCRSSLLTSCRRRRRSSLRRLGSRGLRGRRDLVRRNRCSGSGLRRRYFVFLLLIRHSVCSTFFSSPVITCSLHKPSGRLNSLVPFKTTDIIDLYRDDCVNYAALV